MPGGVDFDVESDVFVAIRNVSWALFCVGWGEFYFGGVLIRNWGVVGDWRCDLGWLGGEIPVLGGEEM